jgi:transcription initiation factor TFIIE subunit alpha
VKKDKATLAYFEKMVGPQGLEMITRLSQNELTDQQIAQETGFDINMVRRTLSTLYEHRFAFYAVERDKETGWMLYRWHLDLEDIEHRLIADAQKLIAQLETWLDGELNTVYYTCDSRCDRYTFENASGYVCGYEFVCPTCKQRLYHDDSSTKTDNLREKINELKTDERAIFYPENLSIFELAKTLQE